MKTDLFFRTSLVCLAFLLATQIVLLADKSVNSADFSYSVPDDWQVKEMAGLKYKIAFAKPENGFAPNVNVVTEKFAGSIEKYADANERTLEKRLPGYKKVSRGAFVTKSGLKGVKAAVLQTQQGKSLRSTFYLFEGKKNVKFVVTCTTLSADGDKYDAGFDKILKSFVLK